VERRDIRVADERLGVLGDRVEVEVGNDLRGAVPATQELHDVDLGIGEQPGDVACPGSGIARDEVIAGVNAVGELDAVAAFLVPTDAAVDLGPLLERARRGCDADRPSGRKRARLHEPAPVSDTVPEVCRYATVPLPRRNSSQRRVSDTNTEL
jgi:hypothetical protein